MRMPLLDYEDLTPELQAMATQWAKKEGGDPNVIRMFGHAPRLIAHYLRFYSPILLGGSIEYRAKEICRLRVAFANQCHY